MPAATPPPLGPNDPLIGQLVDGRIRVDGFLARGGMGALYRGEQVGLGRPVAIKVLRARGPAEDRASFERRFLREAEIAARLTHPNTVRIFDFGRLETGEPYLVMELLHGETLADRLRAGPMNPERLCGIVRQACGSLSEAHEMGVIHRDLKPSNLFLVDDARDNDTVKVVDFGLVKRIDDDVETTRAGVLLGSPLYMSPEQITGREVDSRSDVYALGMVLFLGLTGRSPFDAQQVSAVLVAHVNDRVGSLSEVAPERDLPECLDWVVQRCLAKRPEDRFASVRELARALMACEAFLRGDVDDLPLEMRNGQVVLPEGVHVTLGTMSPVYVGGRGWIRRPQRAIAALVAVFALLVSLGALATAIRASMSGPPVERPEPIGVAAPERSRVSVRVEPVQADLYRGDVYVGSGYIELELASGEVVELTASHPGFVERTVQVTAATPSVSVTLRPIEQAEAPSPIAAPPTRPTPAPAPAVADPVPESPGVPESDLRDPWGRTP